jgi:hypothetical protein
MTRSSLLQMLGLGAVLIGSSLFAVGALYFYYSTREVQFNPSTAGLLRYALSYLLLSIDVWQAILLRFGKNL